LIVDHEHVASDMSRAVAQLRAIRSVADTPVLVRIRDHGEGSIKPLLDAGFDGIVAANVASADAARSIVEAAHYPPVGRRGAHYTVSRAAHYGALSASAVEQAQRETLVIVMIESAAGLAAIPEIARVDGIDMFFIGPLDLTTDIGPYGDLGSGELKSAIGQFEQAVLASGAMLGGALVPGDTPQQAYARGYRLVTGASDVGLLLNAARAAVAAAGA
jgi:2-keto-3-deoxy-L-rhamnonate aldolase RhmA